MCDSESIATGLPGTLPTAKRPTLGSCHAQARCPRQRWHRGPGARSPAPDFLSVRSVRRLSFSYSLQLTIILLQRIYNSRLPRWLPKRLLSASRHRVFRSRRFPLLLPVAHQLTAHSHSGSPQQNARHAAAVATSSTPHMPPRQATPSTSHTSRAPSPGPSSGTKSASEATLLTTKPLVRPPLHFSPSCSPACSRSLLHR